MIEKISIRLSEEWGKTLKVNDEDIACYRYGLELFISTICITAIIVIIAILLQRPLLFLPYLFVYVPMRMYAGGYHAESHLGCIQFSSFSFFVCAIVCRFVKHTGMEYVCLGIIIISGIILKKIVPVEAENKPLCETERNKAKRFVITFQIILLVLWFLAFSFNVFGECIFMLYYAEFAVVVATVMGYIKNCKFNR